ncbi:uncharacterized protein LOC135096376 [Scylla paramamosain]|uniref:uncharacterized protein LOC135096376 n=1 Tax=Scylla paramamosain TaxID=85552 RepID=UPI003082CFF6
MITNKLVVKQNVIEIIVPILIAVKHKPEEQRSPLMKHLLLYLKELMKDYKNEVEQSPEDHTDWHPHCPGVNKVMYFNCKRYHSLNIQLCDANGVILSYCSRFPGATHDAFV